jgi:hypothetical protein
MNHGGGGWISPVRSGWGVVIPVGSPIESIWSILAKVLSPARARRPFGWMDALIFSEIAAAIGREAFCPPSPIEFDTGNCWAGGGDS